MSIIALAIFVLYIIVITIWSRINTIRSIQLLESDNFLKRYTVRNSKYLMILFTVGLTTFIGIYYINLYSSIKFIYSIFMIIIMIIIYTACSYLYINYRSTYLIIREEEIYYYGSKNYNFIIVYKEITGVVRGKEGVNLFYDEKYHTIPDIFKNFDTLVAFISKRVHSSTRYED